MPNSIKRNTLTMKSKFKNSFLENNGQINIGIVDPEFLNKIDNALESLNYLDDDNDNDNEYYEKQVSITSVESILSSGFDSSNFSSVREVDQLIN